MLAVQFNIVTKKFDSFRKPFITNKHLSVVQWEEIMFTLNLKLRKQLKLSEDEQLNTKGEFSIDESLLVTYEAKPKDECYIDFDKLSFPYDLSWMLTVTVSRSDRSPCKEPTAKALKSPRNTTLSQKSSNEAGAVSQSTTLSVPSVQEYEPSPQTKDIMSRYTPGKLEGSNQKVLGSSEYFPKNTGKSQTPSSSYKASRIDRNGVDFEQAISTSKIEKTISSSKVKKELFGSSDDDVSPIVVSSQDSGETAVVRPKKRALLETVTEEPDVRTRSHKKVTVAGWVNKGTYFKDHPIPKKSSRSSKAKSNKDTEAGTSSKKQKTTKENKDPIDLFDEENMEKMRDFVANSLIRKERQEERKEELKDLEIKDCTDMSNNELKRWEL